MLVRAIQQNTSIARVLFFVLFCFVLFRFVLFCFVLFCFVLFLFLFFCFCFCFCFFSFYSRRGLSYSAVLLTEKKIKFPGVDVILTFRLSCTVKTPTGSRTRIRV